METCNGRPSWCRNHRKGITKKGIKQRLDSKKLLKSPKLYAKWKTYDNSFNAEIAK